MLTPNRSESYDRAKDGLRGAASADVLGFIAKALRHRFRFTIVVFCTCIAIGVMYLASAPRIYVASALVAVDSRNGELAGEPRANRSDVGVDVGTVQTQIEIIKSEKVGRAVIDQLHLTEDPEFAGTGSSFFAQPIKHIVAYFAPQPKTTQANLVRQVLAAFARQRTATRVGQSYVIEIEFGSTDPRKAARIANAIADAYVNNELQSKYDAIRRGSEWLQSRMNELRLQVSAQQRAALDFREKNNIVGADGRLINEQQLSELNTQLILARAATAEAKARYERIREVVRQEVPDATTTEALKSEVIIKLREQYLQLAQREALLTEKLGAGHLAVVNLHAQMTQMLRLIQDEMRKIEQSYKSEFEVAQSRELSLGKNVADAIVQSQVTNQAQIQLHELEGGAASARTLHDTFLQRYLDAVQRETFPLMEARLVSPADEPLSPTYPKKVLIALLVAVGGFVLSVGAAIVLELKDRTVRSSEQVEEALDVRCLALVPDMRPRRSLFTLLAKDAYRDKGSNPVMADQALDHPLSEFSEAMRGLKVGIDSCRRFHRTNVIGITSTLPHEGKSTIAANLARLIANAGGRGILIDADLRNPTLSRLVGADRPGLLDAVADSGLVYRDLLYTDPRCGLAILAAGSRPPTADTNEILASQGMKRLVEAASADFDYVIVDLPPLIPVVDARSTAECIGSYIYVVEWGQTTVDIIEHCLSVAPEIRAKLLGIVINKVDMSSVERYEPFRAYYKKYYNIYGKETNKVI